MKELSALADLLPHIPLLFSYNLCFDPLSSHLRLPIREREHPEKKSALEDNRLHYPHPSP
jgi:hypothetical protein